MNVGLSNATIPPLESRQRTTDLRESQSVETTEADKVERELLLEIANSNSSQALESFYHIYRRKLGSFLYRILKNPAMLDEVFNDVMHIVWCKADQFNGSSKVSTWVYSIAYRNCLQHLRKENKHQVDADEYEQPHTEDEQLDNDNKEFIRKALQLLSPEHRLVIELSYFAGNTYGEIAEIANCPENTIKTRMYYARRKLQEIMLELGEDRATLS